MRLLIATARTQGDRRTDLAHAKDGELVWIPDLCPRAILRPGEPVCMCARSFVGVSSGAPTTTALVVETDLSRREVTAIMRSGALVNGWPATCAGHLTDHVLAIAARWPTGTVLERDAGVFRARSAP
jgi:hypothetical protein